MPRHDRAYGRWHSPGSRGTSTRRRRSAKNTYAVKQYQPVAGRNDGNTPPPNAPKPQGGKPPKGGSKGTPQPKDAPKDK